MTTDSTLQEVAPAKQKKRKSRHVGVQLDVPLPSKKEMAKWAPLVHVCKELVASNGSSSHWQPKNKVRISFKLNTKGIPITPEGFPSGLNKIACDGGVSMEYNAESVLMWLWERKLSDMNTSMLYRKRKRFLMQIKIVETNLDKLPYELYNDYETEIEDFDD